MKSFLGRRISHFWEILGPGFTTGAADDDPSGIATYSQAGAQFGLSLLWLAAFSLPLMAVIQEMCARIGIATGRGLASNIKRHFPKSVLYSLTILLFLANTLNIGADLGAMAQSTLLLFPHLRFGYVVLGFAALSLILQIFLSYGVYSKYLKYLALVLLAYVFSALWVQGVNWGEVILKAFTPQFLFSKQALLMICAILGTTISPYLFFWQTAQEVEEGIANGETSIKKRQDSATALSYRNMRIDVWFGMLFSNLIMFFIITATALTIFGNAGTITSAADAAVALKPFVGNLAYLVFTLGIVGTGLLAIPVLAGSAAYATSESLGLKEGLSKKWFQAVPFYLILTLSVIVGMCINFFNIDTIKALIYSAVLNGFVAPFILAAIVILSQNKKVMGKAVNNKFTTVFGWLVVLIMVVVSIFAVYSII